MRRPRRPNELLRRYPLLVFAVPGALAFVAALSLTHGNGAIHSYAVDASWGFGIVLALGALGAPRAYRNDIVRCSGIDVIDEMTGEEFEARLGTLFTGFGYRVNLTKASGDFGADLVLEADGTRTVVQAKRYDSPVGIEAVQEVIGAKAHYGASEAWVVTNSEFTDAAFTLADENRVVLIDRSELVECLGLESLGPKGAVGPELALRQIFSGIRPAVVYSVSLVLALAAVAITYVAYLARDESHQQNHQHKGLRSSQLRQMFGDYAVLSSVHKRIAA